MARDKKTISRSTYPKSIKSELAYRRAQQQLLESNRRIAETKLLALRMQMNPHFVYNSLNAINKFVLENEAEQASLYLTKFSKLMRQAMLNTLSEWVSLSHELKALQIYIELELLRSDNAFEMILNVSDSLKPDTVCIPPMITYPYVENAIRHGLLQQHVHKPTLRIDCFEQDGNLLIQIADNGIGRAASAQAQLDGLTAHKSYGHSITVERLQLVNEVYDVGSRIDFTDLNTPSGNPAGTCVTFTMKLKTL
ncbi:sensor histidine kinase [Spirosoma sp. KNUC1025]|uniref:sensor histidine kinase n=1 Tax=Spirosoma sp. KNUC1025 TaxID=2894082 RepID=UPI00386CB276|nr:histidine kinase [Spirosoma sp. KNUC1025]